jgi:hypothetical protein
MADVLLNLEASGVSLGKPITANPRPITAANQGKFESALGAVRAARAARAPGTNLTDGALHFNMRSTRSTAPFMRQYPLVRQHGPFFNDLARITTMPYGREAGGLRTWVYINIYE